MEELLYAVAVGGRTRSRGGAASCSKPWACCSASSRRRFWSSTGGSTPGTARNKKCQQFDSYPVSARRWHALVAHVADPKAFRSGRDFSLGLVWFRSRGLDEVGSSAASPAGRPLSAQLVHGRRASSHPLCEDPRQQTSPLAHEAARTATDESRGDRAGQQDRAHGWAMMATGERYRNPSRSPVRPEDDEDGSA